MKKIIIFLFCLIIFINNPSGALAACSRLVYNAKAPAYGLQPCPPNTCEKNAMTAEKFKSFFLALGPVTGGIPLIINQLADDPLSKTKLVYECWPQGATPRDTVYPWCEIGYDYVVATKECCPNDPLIPWDQRASLCKKTASTPQCDKLSLVNKTYKYDPETEQCVEVFPEDAGTIKIIKPTACCFSRDSLTGTCDTDGIQTSLGCFPTNPGNLVSWLFMVAVGVGGGIAFLIAIYGAFLFMTSAGDPEKLKEAQATLTASIMGILFIIFSVFLLRLIGFTILKIPGWR